MPGEAGERKAHQNSHESQWASKAADPDMSHRNQAAAKVTVRLQHRIPWAAFSQPKKKSSESDSNFNIGTQLLTIRNFSSFSKQSFPLVLLLFLPQ